MLKLAMLSVVACFAVEGAILVAIAPRKVERLPLSPRTVHVSETRPSHEVGDADTEEVEVMRSDALVLPPLDLHANRPHNANAARKAGKMVCGPMHPMAGRPDGKPSLFYGRVARCEVM